MNYRSFRNVLVMALVAVAAASGCAKIEKESRSLKLDQAVRLYADSIRWGNFDIAAGLLRRRDGGATSATVKVPAEVRVTSYASGVLSVNEERSEATVATSFDYYFPDTNKLRTISQTDLWWFDPGTEQWYMDGSLPDFRP
ncbi:MAG TPA: hypothetical protein VLS27_04845 [Gammaproteobacteria bacterium]|nr:hypothetical protein [Gammaproteobacteria bacterium]